MPHYSAFEPWIVPAAFILGGIFLGLIAEKLFLPVVLRATKKIHFETFTVIARAMRGIVFLWGFLAGLTGALNTAPIKAESVKFLSHVPVVLFLLSLTVVLARISVGFFDLHAKKKDGDTPTISLFTLIIKLVVYALGIMVILQSLGISITPVLTALGVGGLAVALALQETLSNLFAGMQILAARQIKPGDFVRLDTGEEGYVTDVTWRNTTIRAINNNMVIVPNAKLAASILTNYHQPIKNMLVYVPVGVHYDSDLEHVERVTLDVAREVQAAVVGAQKDHEPRIRYNEFGGSSINFRTVLAVEEYYDSYQLTHEFVKRLHKRYTEEGIVIPFHMRTLHIPDNPEITVRLHPDSGSLREENGS
jgi:small-conductance mechanosensitive channel